MSIESFSLELDNLENVRELSRPTVARWMMGHVSLWAYNWNPDMWQIDYTTDDFDMAVFTMTTEVTQQVA